MRDIFVPGRLCLFGEHSDWAGAYRAYNSTLYVGHAIAANIQLGISARAEQDENFEVFPLSEQSLPFAVSSEQYRELADMARDGSYWSMVAGTMWYMITNYHVGGISIDIYRCTLPAGHGFASSAAVCTLVAEAFNQVYSLGMSKPDIMHAAYIGEISTGSRCGRMDQAVAYGPGLVHMTFDGDLIRHEEIVAGLPLNIVVAKLPREKRTTEILAALHRCYPWPNTFEAANCVEALGLDNALLVQDAIDAIEAGNLVAIGENMEEAEMRFNRDIAPLCELLDDEQARTLREDRHLAENCLGCKGVGSHGGGAMQFLCESEEHADRFAFMAADRYDKAEIQQIYIPGGDDAK